MKNWLLVLTLLLANNAILNAQKLWTEADRQDLLSRLENTRNALIQAVDGLSEAQWHFKPDSASWSIAEVVEHLGVYEEYLYWDLFYGQYTPQRADLAEKVKDNDAQFLEYATDPGKGQSPWLAVPIGRFEKGAELIHFFNRFRNEVIQYLKTTDCDLRLHFTYRAPGGGIWSKRDLHQHTLIWIAHTTRHTNQIERVKMSEGFLKE